MKEIPDSEIVYVTLQRPMTAAQLREEIKKEREKAEAKLKEGEEVDNTAIAARVQARREIKVALVAATRRKAFDRARAKADVQDKYKTLFGLPEWNQELWQAIDSDPDVRRDWITLWQAADILGALVADKCKNWQPPATIEGWLDVYDWIFDPVYDAAIELNPQWGAEMQPAGN